MSNIRVVCDPDECRHLWRSVIPAQYVSDLWEVRQCFQNHYRRPLHFIAAENSGRLSGLLPLSRIEETDSVGFFPGEVWHGKTWLEQNRIFAEDSHIFGEMLRFLKKSRLRYHLRYLVPTNSISSTRERVDEIGYLFHPPDFDYDMENYFQLFSHKSAKRIRREIEGFKAQNLSIRLDAIDDFELMVRLNIERFGESSYFTDPQFTAGFRDLADYLRQQGWLRFTAVLINGEPAAVDMGCVYEGIYTLMAGGTNGNFPGIAKFINLHHMQRACNERLAGVDFLCGDFSWKTMFHLTARPLYLISNMVEDERPQVRPTVLLPSERILPDAGRSLNV